MSYPNRSIFLSPTEQDRIRTLLGAVKPINEFLSSAVEKIEDGKGWAESLTAAAPWLKDVAEAAGTAIPVVGAAVKLLNKWVGQTQPFELGAVVCTLAYQNAVRDALASVTTSALQFQATRGVPKDVVRQIRNSAPVEEADLSTFLLQDAPNHIFVRRADRALGIALQAADFDDAAQTEIFNRVHDKFREHLLLLLTDTRTAEKFAPFKTAITDLAENVEARRASIALAAHAEYQREQYEADPVFRYEPFALKNIYVETECGALTWGEIERHLHEAREHGAGSFPAFVEENGGRQDLLETVMGLVKDQSFNEAIVIQGYAGAGKSSFTLRLSVELLKAGFCPVRVRLKKLTLGKSFIEALPSAIELGDEERLAKNPLSRPNDLLLGGRIFNERRGQSNLSRYVLILDGWDELSLAEDRNFADNIRELLRQVRDEFFGGRYETRVRVIVTGRPSNDLATANYFLRADTRLLTMRSMRPDQLRDLVARLQKALAENPIPVVAGDHWMIPDLARFAQVFERYEEDYRQQNESASSEDPDAIEEEADEVEPLIAEESAADAIDSEETSAESVAPFVPPPRRLRWVSSGSMEVLGLPLLAHLAIRVMAQTKDDLNKLIEQPTRLYRQLTDMTCRNAGKFVQDGRDTASERDVWWRVPGAELRGLLQRTAGAMTVNGDEYISKEQLLRRLFGGEDDGTTGVMDELTKKADEHRLSKLMISFFFKGGHPQMGCEFAHKSFREYLFAECIVECLKDFGRTIEDEKVGLHPRPKPERDFAEDDPRHAFSRRLSEWLAPQWLKGEVLAHLGELLKWEIERSRTPDPDASSPALTFRQWERIRDGLADLWQWWAEGVHLRPQWERGRKRTDTPQIVPPYVYELLQWMAPLDQAQTNTAISFEPVTTADAHLGDGLFQLCAWTHFLIAKADGWLASRGASEDEPTPEQLWEGVTARKVSSWPFGEERALGRGDAPHLFQAGIVQGARNWRVFAPSGSEAGVFQRCIARVNATEGRPTGMFPSDAVMDGLDLRGARLNSTHLEFTRLNFANFDFALLTFASFDFASLGFASFNFAVLTNASLDFANLAAAHLSQAEFLTLPQLESAWINEATHLPKQLAAMKPQLLEQQRQRGKAAREAENEINYSGAVNSDETE
jgi:hypothetical protein